MSLGLWLLPLGLALAHPDVMHPRGEAGMREGLADIIDTENVEYWMAEGMEELQLAESVSKDLNENIARNIILFIGDGMSIPTVSAARIYKGQQATGGDGNAAKLSWDEFPHVGLSKTYSINNMVPDSAATASSMFTGVKTIQYTMGFDSHIVLGDPDSISNATALKTILDWAQEAGMATGLVTNTHVSHATPGALYAKSADRNWECDSAIPTRHREKVKDITLQLVENSPGKDADIVLGGGLASFLPYYGLYNNSKAARDFDYSSDVFKCTREDGRNLIQEWESSHEGGLFVDTKQVLTTIDPAKQSSVLGLFGWGHMAYEDQLRENTVVPTVKEMTVAAINFLKNKPGKNGFFLMVEGGKIDHAHHGSEGPRALNEALGLDRAVAAAVELVDLKDTLILVTADHAHTFSVGGYPSRLADITGADDAQKASDKKPYTIISYGNGPGFKDFQVDTNGDSSWQSIVRKEMPGSGDFTYINNSPIPLSSETHGGDDVGIWATGPLSHYVHGVHQQTYIAHLMSLAACIGPHRENERCAGVGRLTVRSGGHLSAHLSSLAFGPLVLLLLCYFR